MKFLDGKKTYGVAILWVIALVIQQQGFISPGQLDGVQNVLAPLGLAALRAGIK